jgi:hypothetical protein
VVTLAEFRDHIAKAYKHFLLGVLWMSLADHAWLGKDVKIEMVPNLNGDPDHLLVSIPGDIQFTVAVVPVPKEEAPPDDGHPVSM